MAAGASSVRSYLDSADTRATLEAVRALGCSVEWESGSAKGALDVRIDGVGLRGPGEAANVGKSVAIDVGNAGTLLRLLPGWLAGQGLGSWAMAGDASIARRPVDRIVTPLRQMGASIESSDGLPPLQIQGADLTGIEYEMPVASAQVKSCLLLAGLLADRPTEIVEQTPSRDHTERMLAAAGVKLTVQKVGSGLSLGGSLPGRRIRVEPSTSLQPGDHHVPGDFSSAAFFIVAATIVPKSRIVIKGVGLNPTRVGLLGILNRMGAAIEVIEEPSGLGEPLGTIDVRPARLRGTTVQAGEVPLAIDELPLVGLLGCFAEGRTVVRGAAELRHKESDRIAAVVELLTAIGGEAEALDDGFIVTGTGGLRGGAVDARGDHRLAMIGALAGLASREGVEVDGMEAAAVSYPGFEADLADLSAA